MIIPAPKEPELEAPRNDLDLAMQLLNSVLDNPIEGVTPDELENIRRRRARQMLNAAQSLYAAVTGQNINTPRGAT